MKILNLYCGIGGNRKLWGNKYNITAIENIEKIADVYKNSFPQDTVIVTDAHEYLLDHYKEFDFIWSSPPLPNTLYYKLFYSTYKKKTSLPFNEIIRRNNFFKTFF